MKRLITLLTFLLIFIISTAFNSQSESAQIKLKDSITTTNINVNFTPASVIVEDNTTNLSQYFEEQNQVNKTIAIELQTLNNKLPEPETIYQTIEAGLGISEKEVIKAIQRNAGLTNLSNLLLFLGGISVIVYLVTLKRIKRGPDVVLKLSTAGLVIVVLIVMKIGMITFMTMLFNPTYHVINQFIQLGG